MSWDRYANCMIELLSRVLYGAWHPVGIPKLAIVIIIVVLPTNDYGRIWLRAFPFWNPRGRARAGPDPCRGTAGGTTLGESTGVTWGVSDAVRVADLLPERTPRRQTVSVPSDNSFKSIGVSRIPRWPATPPPEGMPQHRAWPETRSAERPRPLPTFCPARPGEADASALDKGQGLGEPLCCEDRRRARPRNSTRAGAGNGHRTSDVVRGAGQGGSRWEGPCTPPQTHQEQLSLCVVLSSALCRGSASPAAFREEGQETLRQGGSLGLTSSLQPADRG